MNTNRKGIGQIERGPIYEAMVSCLTQEGWYVRRLRGVPSVQVPVAACNGSFVVFGHADEDLCQVIFRARYSIKVPACRAKVVHGAIELANEQLSMDLGNFTLEGDCIVFKTGHEVDANQLHMCQWRRLFLRTVRTADEWLPVFTRVVSGPLTSDDLDAFDTAPLYSLGEVISEASASLDR